MEIIWLLTIFISNPCCDISVTRFESEAECVAARETVMGLWSGRSMQAMTIGCAIATVKQ